VSLKALSSEDRKNLLFEKATANEQRRQREAFLASLPFDLRTYLETCACVYTPEATEILQSFFPVSEVGVGYRKQLLPQGYLFKEAVKVEEALSIVRELGSKHDAAEGILMMNVASELWLEHPSDAVLVPLLPLFRVNFGWAYQSFKRLWKFSSNCIYLTTVDLSAGLGIDHYYGVLTNDNNEGLVYEAALWG